MDLYSHAAAEVIVVLACLELKVPIVPVSVYDQHASGRLDGLVATLTENGSHSSVALCASEGDRDPALAVFYEAGISRILHLDALGNLRERLDVPDQLPSDLRNHGEDDDSSYVLSTSGSTGTPRLVVGSHQSTYRRLVWFWKNFTPSRRVARRSKLTFVDGITELLQTLLCPESILVTVHPDVLRDHGAASLLALRPTQMTLLPSQLAQILRLLSISDDLSREHDGSSLERIIISGERCSPALLAIFGQWSRNKKVQLINLYGQTESTGEVLCAVLTDTPESKAVVDGVVAVGRPILDSIDVSLGHKTDSANKDSSLNDEIAIRGNLARGYLKASCLEKLETLRTGDTGFCRDGIWYIQGRCDDRIKINGQ